MNLAGYDQPFLAVVAAIVRTLQIGSVKQLDSVLESNSVLS